MLWKALDKSGLPICTVMGDDEAEAKAEVRRQLGKNLSRMAYLKEWENAGEIVIAETEEE